MADRLHRRAPARRHDRRRARLGPSGSSRCCPRCGPPPRRPTPTARFPVGHVQLLREAGLLGLVVPEEFGGLGGTLRDLAAATFAMGTACPSTALAYFFHNTSASRGLLPLEAIEAGLFDRRRGAGGAGVRPQGAATGWPPASGWPTSPASR